MRRDSSLQVAAALRQYIRDRVKVQFDGIDDTDGFIAEAEDEKTGLINEVMTIGNLLTVRGYGLKIEWQGVYEDTVGLRFDDGQTTPTKARIIAVNEPKTLKAIVPADLKPGRAYTLQVVTQSSAKGNGGILKTVREVRSDFKLTAQA